MSEFIQPLNYNASIHREILDAITRENEEILKIYEDRSAAEMRSLLALRRHKSNKKL